MRLLFVPLTLAGLLGCGPVQSTATIMDAQAALEAARAAGAEKTATYEYVSAQSYLDKARETRNRALYERSESYAKKARDLAKEARVKAAAAATHQGDKS